MCATLVARKIELSEARGIKEPPPHWKLEPKAEYHSSPTWQQASRRSGAGRRARAAGSGKPALSDRRKEGP